jgi:two-component system NtrC family sensor kinase
MGMINPISNEPGCASQGCHPSPDTQKILGVVDVTMSLKDVDRDLATARAQVIGFNALSIVAIAILMVLLIMRLVVRRVDQLVVGTNRVADGDLHYAIPVGSDDELGHLARSFNHMTARLAQADQEVREAQAHLLRVEKLATVGRMAAAVAHEINNPLAGVFTYLRLVTRRISEGKTGAQDLEKLKEHLTTMAREVERATAIALNLLDFTRPTAPERRPARLNDAVEEAVALAAERLAGAQVRLDLHLGEVPEVELDQAQMKQVFLNIIANACEAMGTGGVLTVRSRPGDAPGTVVVEFVDTGPGVAPDVLPRLFDPFVTTKDTKSGLGLAVAYGIVSRHDGKIEVASRPGGGTRFSVVLPVAAPPTQAAEGIIP